jgi:hypothetical protein
VKGWRHDEMQAGPTFGGSSGAADSVGAGADAAPQLAVGGHRGLGGHPNPATRGHLKIGHHG